MNDLPNHPGFSIQELTEKEFQPYWDQYHSKIFGPKPRLKLDLLLSDSERDQTKNLRTYMGNPLVLRYGLFRGKNFAGWHIGDQKSGMEFYMRNSAVLPEYRRKGLYSELLQYVVKDLTEKGFQTITSRHTAVNNAVIIPKLKLGFVITGMELSDLFGTLVNLTYYSNPKRSKVLAFRAGEEQVDSELRLWLGMP